MKIYIASSWKNKHGVEMLTQLLRDRGHEVLSWIENNYGEHTEMPFEQWIRTDKANQSFEFDTQAAITCDLFIYYGPAGKDACAEMGAAWTTGKMIVALYAKGEDLGLMRKMVHEWYDQYTELLAGIDALVNAWEKKQVLATA